MRQRDRRGGRARLIVAVLTVVSATAILMGLGGAGAIAKSATPPGVAKAEAALAKYEGTTKFKPLGTTLKGVKTSLAGKTVMYIPITQQVPVFPVIESGLKAALKTVGATLRICDGQAVPSAIAACLSEAVTSHVAAVVTDSIPYGLGEQGFNALEAAHIPILLSDEPSVGPNGPTRGNDTLSFLESNQNRSMALSADWIIANSDGKANVLVIEITDSPLTIQAITQGALPQFSSLCPGCTVHTITETTANLGDLASAVSAALLSDPSTNYVFSEFDTDVQPTVGGVTQSGYTSKVTGVSSMGILGSLQMIHSHNFLAADTGTDGVVQGWSDADQLFRMLLNKPVLQSDNTPTRVFTSKNVKSLTLSPAAEDSGSWYGPTTFKAEYEKLWGLG